MTKHTLLQPYKEGTYSDRNTGKACWSCQGLMDHAPGERCAYPDTHRQEPMAFYYAQVDDNGILCVDQVNDGEHWRVWAEEEIARHAGAYPDTIYFAVPVRRNDTPPDASRAHA